MLRRIVGWLVALICGGWLVGVDAFHRPASFRGWLTPAKSYKSTRTTIASGSTISSPKIRFSPLASSNPDLFSDDLFGDDIIEVPKKKIEATTPIKSKSKYLDQDWQLSAEDQKEYKGFGKKVGKKDSSTKAEVIFPCFALMYRLRKEYVATTIEVALADHNSYCTRFKRLINSEVITLRNRKGFVLLWAGLSATDKEETLAEIKEFLEEDPLITKDMIEKWDIIDLDPRESEKNANVDTLADASVSGEVSSEMAHSTSEELPSIAD